MDDDADAASQGIVAYAVGRNCSLRVRLYHALRHWRLFFLLELKHLCITTRAQALPTFTAAPESLVSEVMEGEVGKELFKRAFQELAVLDEQADLYCVSDARNVRLDLAFLDSLQGHAEDHRRRWMPLLRELFPCASSHLKDEVNLILIECLRKYFGVPAFFIIISTISYQIQYELRLVEARNNSCNVRACLGQRTRQWCAKRRRSAPYPTSQNDT
jgi:hypothetical protein